MNSKKTIKKTKLIKLLSTFSPLEWKRFGRFVQSPFHNTNQSIIQLYTILKKAAPYEQLKNLEEERIYKKIFGQASFDVAKFRNLCSDLYKLATDFIVQIHLTKEKRKKDKLLVDALAERNYELFKSNSQQLIKEVEVQAYFLDEDDFLLLYQLNDGLWHHLERDKYTTASKEFFNAEKNLDLFFKTAQIQFEAENNSYSTYITREQRIKDNAQNRLTDLFQLVMELYEEKSSAKYFQLKEQVIENWVYLKTKHKTNLLLHLISFSTTHEITIDEIDLKERLSLYKIGVVNKLFIIDNKMRDIEFFNICLIGFKIGEEEWTMEFIEQHQHFLSNEYKSFLIPLVYAYKALFERKPQVVIELLSKVNPANQLNYLNKIKSLLIRAYFELVLKGNDEYLTPLLYEIASTKKLFNRNDKLSLLKRKAMINFVILAKKLVSLFLKNNPVKEDFEEFERLLSTTTPLILRHWINDKFHQIKNDTF